MSDFNDDHDTDAMLEAADVERKGRYTDAQLERDNALLDTGHHDRRLAKRLEEDPEFRAEFERQRRC